ncbi:MAG: ribonuclease [Anaerolineae bacterium]|nr:ribonuclease [Anaerolineae bacterium]
MPTLSPDNEPAPTVRATAIPTTARRTLVPTSNPSINCNRTLVGGHYPKIPTLNITDLYRCRPEARTTINMIKRDGPFTYDQDDAVFANREGYLPSMPRASYREYTVVTPGASTRGTRRMITQGDPNRRPSKYTILYYTDDHYDSFWQVVER